MQGICVFVLILPVVVKAQVSSLSINKYNERAYQQDESKDLSIYRAVAKEMKQKAKSDPSLAGKDYDKLKYLEECYKIFKENFDNDYRNYFKIPAGSPYRFSTASNASYSVIQDRLVSAFNFLDSLYLNSSDQSMKITALELLKYRTAAQEIYGENSEDPKRAVEKASPFDHFWLQAKVGAALTNFDETNIVPSAKMVLGQVDQFSSRDAFRLFVVGNIGQLGSPSDTSFQANVSTLIESDNGLYVGVSPVLLLNKRNTNSNYWTLFGSLGYKFNSISTQSIVETDTTIMQQPFSQGRLSAGLQFEGLRLSGNNEPFTISIEGAFTYFSESDFNEYFGEKESSIFSFSASVIMPLSNRLGLQVIWDTNNLTESVFRSGLIFVPKVGESSFTS